MADSEKVINGLECCTTQGFGCIENKKCPYGAQRYGSHCVDSMLRDAIALLKAQEPRVMTPDEVKNAPEKSVVWLELKPDEIFKNEIYPFVGSGTGWYSCYCSANTAPMFTDDDVEKYGVEFRCWTSRPDEKRRGATLWN
jgi:hypothetical protein